MSLSFHFALANTSCGSYSPFVMTNSVSLIVQQQMHAKLLWVQHAPFFIACF